MTYGYTRVSTDTQTLENQVYGIKQYAKQHSLSVDVWFEEKVSGTKKASDRELGQLLKLVKDKDIIIVTEISRIGRSTIDVLGTINYIRERGATLIAIKQGFVLDDSLNSKIIGYIFSILSEVERDLLSQRVKEGLAARKAAGMVLGRRKGSKNKKNSLEDKKEFIEIMLKGGASRYQIKKRLRCHSWTLNNFLHESGLDKKYGIELSDNFMKNKLRLNNK